MIGDEAQQLTISIVFCTIRQINAKVCKGVISPIVSLNSILITNPDLVKRILHYARNEISCDRFSVLIIMKEVGCFYSIIQA